MKEVFIIGSAGVWAKGKDLDDAYKNATKLGGVGKQVGIAVLPVEAEGYVNDYGMLSYKAGFRSVWVNFSPDGNKMWPNRRTPAMREAVQKALAV